MVFFFFFPLSCCLFPGNKEFPNIWDGRPKIMCFLIGKLGLLSEYVQGILPKEQVEECISHQHPYLQICKFQPRHNRRANNLRETWFTMEGSALLLSQVLGQPSMLSPWSKPFYSNGTACTPTWLLRGPHIFLQKERDGKVYRLVWKLTTSMFAEKIQKQQSDP